MKRSITGSLLLIAALILSSCGTPATPTAPPVMTEEPVMTEPPATTEAPPPTNTPEAPAPIEGEATVDVSGFRFSPGTITIKVGTTVTWTNNGDNEHTVTSDDGLFDGSLPGGGTFSFTFTEAGEFSYHCDIHREMRGRIVVVE